MKKRDYKKSSIQNYRSSLVRFFKYLDSNKINSMQDITAEFLVEYVMQDFHRTPEGKNNYTSKLRTFLSYCGDLKIVPTSLSTILQPATSRKTVIIEILNQTEIEAIYKYRNEAKTYEELRNTAIVLLGLRTGLRTSDIVTLQLKDIDWKNLTITKIQKKTMKAITLPIAIDVANSLFRYLKYARVDNKTDYLFSSRCKFHSHIAKGTCSMALNSILAKSNLPRRAGFHITRRTYASRLLQTRNDSNIIADALGHKSKDTLMPYLSTDEKGLRMCAIDPNTIYDGD